MRSIKFLIFLSLSILFVVLIFWSEKKVPKTFFIALAIVSFVFSIFFLLYDKSKSKKQEIKRENFEFSARV